MLKEDFTPVWVSVCPVRTVTFDLGEGRSLKGSVNGEIAIYFCNPNGTVYDILPALQSPAATLKAMKEAKAFFDKETKDLEGNNIPYKKVMAMHRARMEKVAGEKHDTLKKQGVKLLNGLGEIMFPVEKVEAPKLYPNSNRGEKIRDSYINAALDKATKDMRIMRMSKMAMSSDPSDAFKAESLVVVEPGGRGYYQWKIGQMFLGKKPVKNPLIQAKNQKQQNSGPNKRLVENLYFRPKYFKPSEWKQPLFEDIFKQELKGGEVKYNSESLEAISIFGE